MVDWALYRALRLLKQPGARLVLTHTSKQRIYRIEPYGGSIGEKLAQRIINRSDMRPLDGGLLPGCAQSWCLRAGS